MAPEGEEEISEAEDERAVLQLCILNIWRDCVLLKTLQ